MARAIESYKDLLVWQKAVDLSVGCYRLSGDLPREEMYGLTQQIRRASVSVAANIAEGHGRETTGAFVHFLRIAQGSLKELETHLILSERVGLIAAGQTGALQGTCDELGRMLRALIRSLQQT